MIIQITEEKVDNLAENIEKGLRYLGKAMQCVDEWKHGTMGERYGERHYGMREDYYPPYEEMGMRRGVAGTGRYSRY